MTETDRLDPQQLLLFLRGELAEPIHSAVEHVVLQSPELSADVVAGDDPLLQSLRGLDDTPGPDDMGTEIESLVQRMSILFPEAPEVSVPKTVVLGVAPLTYPFLGPAERPDELGRLGNYRVLGQLGAGGMGVVLSAEELPLERRVALKVMKPEFAQSPDARQRFLREAQIAARLEHDNVVPIYQVGEFRTVFGTAIPFIAMPLLAGESLADRLEREGALPTADVLRIGREAAQGLAAAHAAGLIHRDVKPDNLWLQHRPAEGSQPVRTQVKVLDFGLARAVDHSALTFQGALLGTPAYMSPEQANGLTLDARSDLFSLGAVLYQMTTGRRPFAQTSLAPLLFAVTSKQPSSPRQLGLDVPAALSDLIERLLTKDPARRPQSAAEVVDAIRAIETALPARRTPPVLPSRPRFLTRRGLLAAALILGFSSVAGGAALLYRFAPPSRRPPEPLAYQASVDVDVWRTEADGGARRQPLVEAVPLHPGDQCRIAVRVRPAAYAYLFWIDSEGEAAPVAPWTPGQWGTRPREERPVDALDLPATLNVGYKIRGDREGMETLLLLLRTDPLPDDDDVLRRDLAGLPVQRPVANRRTVLWFENGRRVREGERVRGFEIQTIDDPMLRLQALLTEKFQSRGQHLTLAFARLGK